MNRRIVLALIGALLIAAGLAIWLGGDFALAARRSGGTILFAGLARGLAGLAPVLVGVGFLALTRGGDRNRWIQLAVGAGIAAALAAFAVAGRG